MYKKIVVFENGQINVKLGLSFLAMKSSDYW